MNIFKKKKYVYRIAYIFKTGNGTTIITRPSPIDHEDEIIELAGWIGKENGLESVGITSYQIIKTFR